jgi:hypothetical protein
MATPSLWQRRVFATLPILYGALRAGLSSLGGPPVPVVPNVIGVYGIGVLFADLCTAAMLGRQFASRNGARVAAAHLRLPVQRLEWCWLHPELQRRCRRRTALWNDYTAGGMFLALRLGPAVLFVAAVAAESRAATSRWQPTLRQLYLAWLVTLLDGSGCCCCLFERPLAADLQEHFTSTSQAISCLTIGLYGVGAYMIWRKRAFNDPLYLWLALILVASAADLTLSTVAGARYTVGWYVARCSSVVSSYLLLTFLLGELASAARSKDATLVAVRYTAAFAIAAAAVVLRWFLLPWLKSDLPYATLFGAIAVAVWMGGWGPALTAAIGRVRRNDRAVWQAAEFRGRRKPFHPPGVWPCMQ